jgi:hypothetical protein
VAAGLLSACQVDNTPKAYNDQVRSNFIASCTGKAPTAASTTVVLASENACVCAYDVFAAKVPYNDDDRSRVAGYPSEAPTFQHLEQELANEPGKYNDLPEPVKTAVEDCQKQANVGPVAPGTAAPGTTAPGTSSTSAPA